MVSHVNMQIILLRNKAESVYGSKIPSRKLINKPHGEAFIYEVKTFLVMIWQSVADTRFVPSQW